MIEDLQQAVIAARDAAAEALREHLDGSVGIGAVSLTVVVEPGDPTSAEWRFAAVVGPERETLEQAPGGAETMNALHQSHREQARRLAPKPAPRPLRKPQAPV